MIESISRKRFLLGSRNLGDYESIPSNENIPVKSDYQTEEEANKSNLSKNADSYNVNCSHHHSLHTIRLGSEETLPNSISEKSNESNKKLVLYQEARIYKMLAGTTGFPRFTHFMSDGENEHLIWTKFINAH